ncbi:MAG: hypothetical protein AAFS02_04490 [Pseudomonadota bacterium]
MLVDIVAALCFAAWFSAAAVLLAATRRMARHNINGKRRRQAATQARVSFTALLVLAGVVALTGTLQHGAALASVYGLGTTTVTLAAGLIALCVFLAVTTLSFPDLPGRAQLRQLENFGFWLLVPALSAVFVIGARSDVGGAVIYGAAGALALVFGFTMAARPFLRGAVVLVSRIETQGTHPGTEATLKRLLRLCRPFVVAGAAALGVMIALVV